MCARAHMHAASTASCRSIATRSTMSGVQADAGSLRLASASTCAWRLGGLGKSDCSGADVTAGTGSGEGSTSSSRGSRDDSARLDALASGISEDEPEKKASLRRTESDGGFLSPRRVKSGAGRLVLRRETQ